MSTIQETRLLDQIHGNRSSISNTLPTSDPAQAKEAAEQSQIQPRDELPQLVVPPESAYDKYEPSFDGEEISHDPLEIARLNNQSTAVEESVQLPSQADLAEENSGFFQAMETELYQNVAEYELGRAPEAPSATTLAEATREKVDLVVTELDKPEPTTEQVLSQSSAIQRSTTRAEIEQGQVEAPDNNLPVTPFAEEQENPLHKQAPLTVLETLQERESPVLHPEEEFELMTPPERPLVPEPPTRPEETNLEAISDSSHIPTYAEPRMPVAMAEERFQQETMENLQIAAQDQSQLLTTPVVVDRPVVEQAEIPPQPEVDTSGTNIQEAVAQQAQTNQREAQNTQSETQNTAPSPSQVTAENNLNQRQAPETTAPEFTQTQTAESAMLEDSNAVAQEEATSPQRTQLQSQGEVYAQEATQNVNYEPIEAPEVDTAPSIGEVSSQIQEEQVAFDAAEIQGIDPEFLEEVLPNPQEVAREEYVPPVFTQTEMADNPLLEEQEYFPPLPGSAPPSVSEEAIAQMTEGTSVSEEAIAQMTADSYEIPPEYSEIQEFEYEIPENEVEVTTMTQEELAYLRNNAAAAQYTPELLHTAEPTVEVEEELPVEENIALEDWVPEAWNMDNNIRFQTQVGEPEIDLTQFEEDYVLPETSDLEDYDYNLVATRIAESAVTHAPKGMYDNFV